MSVKSYITKKIIVNKISDSLTGDPEDLRKLVELREKFEVRDTVKAFIDSIDTSLQKNQGIAPLLLRVGKSASPSYRKKLVRNLIYNNYIEGKQIRDKYCNAETNDWLPNLIVISPTMRCNLRCTGCYSGLYTKDQDLGEEELDRILVDARKHGIYFVVISGGEPYVIKDTLLRMFKKYNDMFFLTYTNGTFLDRETAKKLAKLGNVAAAISVEGFEKETDARRGKGVHAKVVRAMENLRDEGVIVGLSATVTRQNVETITSDEFIEFYLDKGVIFGWYFLFMPVGKDPVLDLVPTPEQRLYCGQRVDQMRKKYPVFLGDFWNDGDAVGGCLSGARHYMHILNSGNVEPCVFMHFSSENIKGKSIYQVANSPFFKAIRRSFPYTSDANLKTPCPIIDNPQILRNLIQEYVVPEGHEHSDAIVRDPEVMEFVDKYSKHLHEINDPIWQEMINDPKNRWYNKGCEYCDLFKFQKNGGHSKTAGGNGKKNIKEKTVEKKKPIENKK